jgi:hypothetical protein
MGGPCGRIKLQECEVPHTPLARRRCSILPKRGQQFAFSSDGVEEIMYAIASVAKKSSGDFTVVMMFSLLGLALSLLAIGKAGLIDPEYLATLLVSF